MLTAAGKTGRFNFAKREFKLVFILRSCVGQKGAEKQGLRSRPSC